MYFSQNFEEIFLYLKRNEVLLCGVLVLILVRFYEQYRKRPKLPPGPFSLPILGYYPFLRKDPEIVLTDLAKKYGNVVGFYIGPKYVVFLNDWEAVKDGLGKNATVDRPPSVFGNIPFNLGFGAASGAEWIQTRRLTSKVMKDVGLQSTRWEELVQEEVRKLVECIMEEGQRPLEVRSFFAQTFTNNILTLIMGERLSSDHPLTKTMSDGVNAISDSTASVAMTNYSTFLTKVLEAFGIEEKFKGYEKVVKFCSTVSNIVEEKLRSLNNESDDSFFARLKKEIDVHHKNPENIRFTDYNQKGTAIALLTGGSHTVRAATIWSLIAMADHPQIQEKVHEELDRVIGKEGFISWAERFKIPYTFAAILESMRWRTVGHIPALRYVNEDTKIQGYDIPKGTFLTTNNWALHNDPRYWSNPEQFIPERFLSDDGKKVNTAPESYNPFSYGVIPSISPNGEITGHPYPPGSPFDKPVKHDGRKLLSSYLAPREPTWCHSSKSPKSPQSHQTSKSPNFLHIGGRKTLGR